MANRTLSDKSSRHRRRTKRGFTLIEVLVAAVIVSVCLAATVSMWYFSFRMSVNTDAQGAAYNLGRRAMEEVKETGFQDTVEGTATLYYDKLGGSKSATRVAAHVYSVTTVVTSSKLNGSVPASDALRTVSITVTSLATNQTLYQTSTYLVRAGI